MSTAERNAWLRQFSQLRIYPFRNRGNAAGSHTARSYLGAADGAAACWPTVGDAAARIGDRRYLWRDGTETPLTTVTVEREDVSGTAVAVAEVRVPGTIAHYTWLGRFAKTTTRTDARQRIYTLRSETPYQSPQSALRITTTTPGTDPISTQYESVTESRSVQSLTAIGVFLSCRRAIGPDVDACRARTGGRACGFAAGHTADQDAGRRVFRRLYLSDPTASTPRRTVATHLDAVRLRMPAYHAQINLDLSRPMSRRAAYAGGGFVGRHASNLGAATRIRHARNALQPLRAARDRVWLRTAIRGTLTASNQLVCSPSLVADQYTEQV
jgi:hypothetical protein